MGVTIRQIAEAAGVSRGTVDRALNNRGRIRPEVAERIRAIADEMGYKPNQLGRALSMSRNNIKIGVILQGAETPFMKEVLKGIQEACAEVDNLGGTVLVHKIEHQNAEDVILAMEKMRMEEVRGIAMVPLDEERVKREIDRFVEEFRIPVVTFTSDVEDTKRLCFVGQNGVQCGRAAAGLMGELTGGKGKKKLPEELEEFLNDVKKEIRTDLLDIHGERVYVMPAGLPNLKGLRFLRTGLLLGELKKKRFEPSQAFAMTLKKDDYEKIVDLPLEDDRVSRYLKGETLDVDDLVEMKAKGWYLVCVDGYPLGWGKLANGTLKNKYLPGWRLNS